MNVLKVATLALISVACCRPCVNAEDKNAQIFEMRTYYSPPGKLDQLHARFRDHTLKLFEKHGMTNVGYWVPIDNPDNKLIYLLAFPSAEARMASWKGFMADPDWQKAYKTSETKGTLVSKLESVVLEATDYSPANKIAGDGERVFELRTYAASRAISTI